MKTAKNFHCFMVLALLLVARPVFSQAATLGVQLCAGVSITGTNVGLFAVQATGNLADSNSWACVGLVQLPATNCFWTDTSKSAASGQRFYRTVQTSTNLVYILPGTFTMGSPTNEALRWTDETQHLVTISKGFYMGRLLVTQSEFQAVTGSNPSVSVGLNLPVNDVPWKSATNYCSLRTAQEQAAGLIPTNWSYRLPTESEWEYACRAGTTTAFYLGSGLYSGQANFNGTREYEASVGTITNANGVGSSGPVVGGNYTANDWGLYDMAGNENEWCWDFYGPYPTTNPGAAVIDPQGPPTGSAGHVLRGGSYLSYGYFCRSAARSSAAALSPPFSFRVVLAPNQ